MIERRRIPWIPAWVWGVSLIMGAFQFATFPIIRYAAPEGMTPTGMHIPDSALFIQAMEMFDTGYFSRYATNLAENGPNDLAYFAIPHLIFYGLQGVAADMLGADRFLFYGLCNGLGAALLLLAMYRFFRTAAPSVAGLAFLLFACAGGIGGVVYLLSAFAGVHDDPAYELYLWRFAVYELVEGAHLFPVTYFARSYYTVSMAACFGALTAFIHALRMPCRAHAWLAGIILVGGAFLNARFGLFTLAIALCYGANAVMRGRTVLPSLAAPLAAGGAAGWLASWALMASSPVMVRNHVELGAMNMHLSPFVTTAVWLLPLCVYEAVHQARRGHLIVRLLLGAGLGYMAAFVLFFAAYQTYYGNWLAARDSAVAVAISDWALIGGLLGAALALRGRPVTMPSRHAWIAVWMLGFLALSVSAFGQGWFLRFGPQRMMVMLCPAMCLCAALALRRIALRRPAAVRRYTGLIVCCGALSIVVSTFFFQAPLGRRPESQAFDETHTSVVTNADARLMEAITPRAPGLPQIGANVLAPLPASDAVAMMRGNSVVFGIGSFNMADQAYMPLRAIDELFFSGRMDDGGRISTLMTFRVHYVFCPDTWPVSPEARAALDGLPYLEPVAEEGRGIVYRVDWPSLEAARGGAGAYRAESAEDLLAYLTRRTADGAVATAPPAL